MLYFQTSSADLDTVFIPQLARCDSKHLDKWTASLYAYKGLLLLFGVYMAWGTRRVTIPVLNDSQYIGKYDSYNKTSLYMTHHNEHDSQYIGKYDS